MPSTINDFPNQIAKASPDVQIAQDYSDEYVWNINGGNLYRRAVTINNTGKTAKTDYLCCILWDSKDVYQDNKCAFTLSDLRVYDSNGTTLLNHHVEAPCNAYTSIFVRVPSIGAGATKTIYFEYGNPALKDVSTLDTLGSVFQKSTLVAWLNANEPLRQTDGGDPNDFLVHYWNNKANRFQSPIAPFVGSTAVVDTVKTPRFRHNVVNGQPAILSGTAGPVNGPQSFRSYLWHTIKLKNLNEISIFGTCYADLTRERYQRQVSFQNPGSGYIINHWWDSGVNNTRFILSNDGATAGGLANNLATGQWNFSGCHWKQNTTNGMQTFRNNVLQAQRNSVNVPLNPGDLHFLSYQSSSLFFSGFTGDILIFSDFLTIPERTQVWEYQNAKYAISSADIPAYTVGAESTVSQQYTFQSKAPFSQWQFKDKLKFAITSIQETTGEAVIQKFMEKVIHSGSPAESAFSISTVNDDSETFQTYGRQITASTSDQIDTVIIQKTEGADNLNDLSKFFDENIVQSTTYLSNNADFISFEAYIEDASLINQSGSWLQFENSAGTNAFRVLLQANMNTLLDGKNEIKFKKSDFTVQAGSPTWQNVSHTMKVNIRTSSGTQKVVYSNFKHTKNYSDDQVFNFGNPLNLNTAISSDNDASYYSHNVLKTHSLGRDVEKDELTMEFGNYFQHVLGLKFKDLPSFPERYVLLSDHVGSPNAPFDFYSVYARKMLGFIFPDTILDIDLDMDSTDQTNQFNQQICIDENDSIRARINALLVASMGFMYFDQSTGKITLRSGYKAWDHEQGLLPTPYEIQNVLEYKKDNDKTEGNWTQIQFIAHIGLQNRVQSYNPLAPMYGYFGTGFLIEPTILAGNRSTVFVPADMPDLFKEIPFNQWYVNGWAVSDSQTSNVPNNAGVTLLDAQLIDGKILMSFENTSGINKYLYALGIGGDFLGYKPVTNFTGTNQSVFSADVKDQAIEQKSGGRRYEIDPTLGWYHIDVTAGVVTIDVPEMYKHSFQQFKDPETIQAKILFDPNVNIGKVVKLRNVDGVSKLAHILNCDCYNEGGNYSQTITARVIREL